LTLNYGRKKFYGIGPGRLLKREGKLSVSFKKTVLFPGFEETMKSLKGPHLFSHSWDRSCKTLFVHLQPRLLLAIKTRELAFGKLHGKRQLHGKMQGNCMGRCSVTGWQDAV
jgi:hypothetical protein